MKKIIIFITILAIAVICVSPAAYASDYSSYVELNCPIDYMISLDDGSEVIAKNAEKRAAPASITKITTALVVLQNCPGWSQSGGPWSVAWRT